MLFRSELVVVTGRLAATANTRYQVEVFGTARASATDADVVLDDITVATNDRGDATFTLRLDRRRLTGLRSLTATATSAAGATSPFSAPLQLPALISR